MQSRMKRVSRRANLAHDGVHILRHSFCSHLAMRGAPVRAIQELAGHADLSMTQRYMHLSPAALDAAIRLLDGPQNAAKFWRHFGDGGKSKGGVDSSNDVTRLPSVASGEFMEASNGGEAGIRTLGRVLKPYNGLANRRLQPLGHLTTES